MGSIRRYMMTSFVFVNRDEGILHVTARAHIREKRGFLYAQFAVGAIRSPWRFKKTYQCW